MAQIIVRPTSDIFVSSNNTYTIGTSAYPMINEVTADDSTTIVSTSTTGAMFTVLCGSVDISKIKTINNVTVHIKCYSLGGASITYGFNAPVSSSTSITITSTYTDYSYTIAVNQTPANFNLSNLQLFATPTTITVVDKVGGNVCVTQMYVVIDYIEKTLTAYVKIDGTWHNVSAMYSKIGGAWKIASGVYEKISGSWHGG